VTSALSHRWGDLPIVGRGVSQAASTSGFRFGKNQGIEYDDSRFLSELFPRRVVSMSAVAAILHSPEESLFSSFLKYAAVGLAFCESSGKILSRNSTFEELVESPPHPAPWALSELAPAEGGGDVRALLAELFDGKRESFQVEGAASGKDSKSLHWTVWAVHGERGRVESAVVMLEDLSDVAFSRRRLQQAARLETIGRLAGGVAHDFNNLLTAVLLYCDLLLSVPGPADRARKYAEEIRTAGLQASGLVGQLLSVASSNKSLPRPVSLNEVADSMRNLLVRLIGDNIKLKVQLDPGHAALLRVGDGSAKRSHHGGRKDSYDR